MFLARRACLLKKNKAICCYKNGRAGGGWGASGFKIQLCLVARWFMLNDKNILIKYFVNRRGAIRISVHKHVKHVFICASVPNAFADNPLFYYPCLLLLPYIK